MKAVNINGLNKSQNTNIAKTELEKSGRNK